jgi:hypothetical protein
MASNAADRLNNLRLSFQGAAIYMQRQFDIATALTLIANRRKGLAGWQLNRLSVCASAHTATHNVRC